MTGAVAEVGRRNLAATRDGERRRDDSRIAFVLSGGGNLGALQVGALQVLLEAGIRPRLLAGTSAGAINAACLATDPTPAGGRRLADIWRRVRKGDIFPGGPLQMGWHLLRHGASLCSSDRLRSFLESHVPTSGPLFRYLAAPLYIAATDLLGGSLYLFGLRPDESVIDGLVASTAIPFVFPPVRYRGRLLADGSLAANLPVGTAIKMGATEIWALDVQGDEPPAGPPRSLREVWLRATSALIRQQLERDLVLCAAHPEVRLRYLPLRTSRGLTFDDFGQTERLIAEGRKLAETYLATPLLPAAAWAR